MIVKHFKLESNLLYALQCLFPLFDWLDNYYIVLLETIAIVSDLFQVEALEQLAAEAGLFLEVLFDTTVSALYFDRGVDLDVHFATGEKCGCQAASNYAVQVATTHIRDRKWTTQSSFISSIR